mmetsp:Transcript_9910/g.38562  ORF Transcript_9910/g.38562 Transcript_9910/m.38562 type:complete len:323 (-) Transcript_9910:3310-4278(-)
MSFGIQGCDAVAAAAAAAIAASSAPSRRILSIRAAAAADDVTPIPGRPSRRRGCPYVTALGAHLRPRPLACAFCASRTASSRKRGAVPSTPYAAAALIPSGLPSLLKHSVWGKSRSRNGPAPRVRSSQHITAHDHTSPLAENFLLLKTSGLCHRIGMPSGASRGTTLSSVVTHRDMPKSDTATLKRDASANGACSCISSTRTLRAAKSPWIAPKSEMARSPRAACRHPCSSTVGLTTRAAVAGITRPKTDGADITPLSSHTGSVHASQALWTSRAQLRRLATTGSMASAPRLSTACIAALSMSEASAPARVGSCRGSMPALA